MGLFLSGLILPMPVGMVLQVLGVAYAALSWWLVSARDDRGPCVDCGTTRAAPFPVPPVQRAWTLRRQRYESMCGQDIARRVLSSRRAATGR